VVVSGWSRLVLLPVAWRGPVNLSRARGRLALAGAGRCWIAWVGGWWWPARRPPGWLPYPVARPTPGPSPPMRARIAPYAAAWATARAGANLILLMPCTGTYPYEQSGAWPGLVCCHLPLSTLPGGGGGGPLADPACPSRVVRDDPHARP
jgi:hypothetical protein